MKRRQAKDLKELLQPIADLFARHKDFISELKKTQVNVELTKNVQAKRTFKPRSVKE